LIEKGRPSLRCRSKVADGKKSKRERCHGEVLGLPKKGFSGKKKISKRKKGGMCVLQWKDEGKMGGEQETRTADTC